ncbi:hypothetical protein J4772_14010 [Cohnella sp. LGH]|uniref:hypothetical protein n=1 Tax=Cohnella sp. LGH TaxID=1619153 RepID=UPI001ADD374C|nr:hypothetical protein [Cohnella sp. LGH]QTH45424.1 hypothetical protein J4772_14010 [Cohnella sp. LGH]
MARKYRLLCAVVLAIAFAGLAVGCASSGGSAKENGETAIPTSESSSGGGDLYEAITPLPAADAADGLAKMNDLVKTYKQAIESDDTAAAQQAAQDLAGTWKAFEEEAAKLDGQRAVAVRENLVLLLEQSGDAKNRDQLVDISYSLYQTIRDLKEKAEGSLLNEDTATEAEDSEIYP